MMFLQSVTVIHFSIFVENFDVSDKNIRIPELRVNMISKLGSYNLLFNCGVANTKLFLSSDT